MSNIKLTTKLVGKIKGHFILPDYQRGYRWTVDEVKKLLNDIFANGKDNYCLQPIVVKRLNGNNSESEESGNEEYELIDGQQRLTTIYLIYRYLNKSSGGFMSGPRFSLKYKTREKSEKYLQTIDPDLADTNIDFYFIHQAYSYIEKYFKDKGDERQSKMADINTFFDQNVSVIWYEVPDCDGVSLFERLNIGKIPLTSSEIVKALFMRKDGANVNRQEEIALQWDYMEQELNKNSFWSFLTNAEAKDYPTRIDLILDLMADKKPGERETYFTFFYFEQKLNSLKDSQQESNALNEVWDEIYRTFLTLREWYSDHEFYHKIGYLIASGQCSLRDIYNLWKKDDKPVKKSDFIACINTEIKNSINKAVNIESLLYTNPEQKKLIERLLLLMNIETERTIAGEARRFPFEMYKYNWENGKKVKWSLEHIHAQHSEGLNTNQKRLAWLKAHISCLTAQGSEEASETVKRMQELADKLTDNKEYKNVKTEFEPLREQAVKLLTDPNQKTDSEEYLHKISNLALLDCSTNSAVSNYVFDAKREIIISKDAEGTFIPICTKKIFFKYLPNGDPQLHFWGELDRISYLDAILNTLADYLPKQDNTEIPEED